MMSLMSLMMMMMMMVVVVVVVITMTIMMAMLMNATKNRESTDNHSGRSAGLMEIVANTSA